MKYQLGTYQTTEGKIEITKIRESKHPYPYIITYMSDPNFPTMGVTEKHLDSIIIQKETATPEPLENWKHPYFGKPILVRNSDNNEWEEHIFEAYALSAYYPVTTKSGICWRFYKFPEPSIQMTTAELLALAKEVKGVEVELKMGSDG